jgi:hypothetical protein
MHVNIRQTIADGDWDKIPFRGFQPSFTMGKLMRRVIINNDTKMLELVD